MRFGSVCSGIEAASVAWAPLGWKASWVSEIEAFPSAVLKHHWPEVPNLGDMLKLPAAVSAEIVDAPDVLVGGTPCQAFSVAGRRESLEDERGALTLAYVELANAIDEQRRAAGKPPAIIVWENVPGVLSTKDNAFGCFLAGLAGEDVPLVAAGGKWSNAGAVFGPARAVAWRILDAQYFGVAQRRRRVFVVASARDGFDPCAVLFERDGLRRDSAPRREAGKGFAADAGAGAARGSHWDDLTNPHPSLNQSHNVGGIRASNQEVFSQRGAGIVPQVFTSHDPAPCLETTSHDYSRADGFCMVAHPVCVTGDVTHTLKAEGFDGSEDGSEDGTGRGQPIVAFHAEALADQLPTEGRDTSISDLLTRSQRAAVAHTVALRGRDGGATAELGGKIATALRASSGGGDKPHVLAFSAKDYGADATEELAPTMRAGGHRDSHANAGVMPAIAFTANDSGNDAGSEVCPTIRTGNGGDQMSPAVAQALAVRRLTPRECERLQGFPDDHTLVPYRGKPAADGPRYKALGNSMAVPVMRWIGQRIVRHMSILEGDIFQ